MDLKKLNIFCEVCRQKSYSLAAKKLGLTQSAVSQQVKSLEADLGVELFDEKLRTLPTAAGDYIYNEGTRILSHIKDVENGLKHVTGIGRGLIRFGMIDVAAISLMPKVLGRFKGAHPNVKLDAEVRTSGELVDMVERYELDFAVVVTNELPETLVRKDIYSDSIVAVVKKNSPLDKKHISVKSLKGEPLILYPTTSHSRRLIENVFRKNGIVPTVNMEMHYPAAILSLVEQGMGVGLISALSAKEISLKGKSVVFIDELKGARKIGIVFHKGRKPSPQALALIGEIIS